MAYIWGFVLLLLIVLNLTIGRAAAETAEPVSNSPSNISQGSPYSLSEAGSHCEIENKKYYLDIHTRNVQMSL